jgi:myosin protein heavy chain
MFAYSVIQQVHILKKKLEEENLVREAHVAELKVRFSKHSEELNEQIVNLRKANANVGKVKQTLEAENVDLANEVKNLNQTKVESERKRKQLELNFTEVSHKYQDSERGRVELTERLCKIQVMWGLWGLWKVGVCGRGEA